MGCVAPFTTFWLWKLVTHCVVAPVDEEAQTGGDALYLRRSTQ